MSNKDSIVYVLIRERHCVFTLEVDEEPVKYFSQSVDKKKLKQLVKDKNSRCASTHFRYKIVSKKLQSDLPEKL